MIYTIYKKSNGEIVFQFGGSQELLELNLDAETQDYVEGNYLRESYYIVDHEPVEISTKPNTYTEFNYDTKEWEATPGTAVVDILEKRQKLLDASDWTQLPNGPLTLEKQTAWATYRQALRDITQQADFPTTVNWPPLPA